MKICNFLHSHSMDLQYVIKWILIPVLCIMGIVGNLLSCSVFLYRISEKIDVIEKGSTICMMALSVSDLSFCVTTLCSTFHESDIIYRGRSFSLYVQMYSLFLQNSGIKISTSITTYLAIYRHFAISRVIDTNRFVQTKYVVCSMIIIFVTWILLMLPYIWIWDQQLIQCEDSLYIMLTSGYFIRNQIFHTTLTYIHAIFGFFFPVCILAYCNMKLIATVRASTHRANLTRQNSSASHRHCMQLRMNITLMLIVCAYFCLVLPGEVLVFVVDILKELNMNTEFKTLDLALLFCNVLQVIDMAFNFGLYCCVNTQFRQTLKLLSNNMTCKARPTQLARRPTLTQPTEQTTQLNSCNSLLYEETAL